MFKTIQSRAAQQAGANTETQPGRVEKTYTDDLGNVIAADVRLSTSTRILTRIPNASGLKLSTKMPITINWTRGSRHEPVILAASGAEVGAAVQGASGSGSTTGSDTTTTSATDLSTLSVLTPFADEALHLGYTVTEGANVAFDLVDPVVGGGEDDPVGGTFTVSVVPLVATELPDPTGLLEGTLVDLIDEDGEPNGMYRLSAGVWVRRDTPGEGGVSTGDRASWDGAATDATQALSDAADAQDAADAAAAVAASAQADANTAQTTADSAVSDAAEAEADAQTAITAAAAAAATAASAQSTANSAGTLAATAATAASAAQSTANTAQTEITNARTRDAVGAFAAQTFGTLKAHLGALWSQIATLKTWLADPAGITVGWILTRTSGGVAWAAPPTAGGSGDGTVTSVDGSGGSTGLTVSGGPITDAGTLTLGGTLAVGSGGTGATTAAAARASLGAAPLAWTILNVATTSGDDAPPDPEGG